MLKFTSLTFATFTVAAWDYKLNGDDWPNLTDVQNNECGGTNQSPIDLSHNVPAEKTLSADQDQFNKIYTNLKNTEVTWLGLSS